MPQLDLTIWFLLVHTTTCLFWFVYIFLLILFRNLIITQGYLVLCKMNLVFIINSTISKWFTLLNFWWSNVSVTQWIYTILNFIINGLQWTAFKVYIYLEFFIICISFIFGFSII